MRSSFAVLTATVWISVHEFIRNQVLLLDHWIGHYQGMGLQFPSEPVNGALWGVWALCSAVALLFLSRRFSLWEAVALGWLFCFVLMWLVIGNLGVLPMSVLPYAVPWSLVEVAGAVWLLKRIAAPAA